MKCVYIKILFPTTKSPLPKLCLQPLLRSFLIWPSVNPHSFTQGSSYIGRIPDRGNMNVRGNILIIWQGGSPISKHPHFDTQSPSPLPALPSSPPSLLPILRFHHLISHPPCHRDLLNPPPFTTTPLSFSLSFSQMSPSFFCSYSRCRVPRGWFNFSGHRRQLCCSLCPL